jgi:hypothetical protein
MIAYLTESQYKKLWKESGMVLADISPLGRYLMWEEHFKHKYKLDYVENGDFQHPAFYGSVTGDEKDINWFLLQL